MSTFAEVLRPYWMAGINEVSGKSTTSFKAWLSEGKYVFQGVDSNQDLLFVPIDFDELKNAVAHDINRMAIAAFETIYGIDNPNELTRSTAWSLIRSYYASFFACHAICRIFAICVPKIDSAQSKTLNKIINSTGNTNSRVSDELYRVEIDVANNVFRMSKQAKGSHEDAWKQFGILLRELEQKVLSSKSSASTVSERQDVALVLDDLRKILQTDNHNHSSNWLSFVRNKINYRHDYGTWYPHERSKNFRSDLISNYSSWKRNPFEISGYRENQDLLKFSKGSLLTISVMRELLEELRDRNSKGDSFLKHGALRLLTPQTSARR
ncbi:hypothetical protein [Undibacterium flavidum]|uniref:Uncharacterized protein n=1 Tax=Undibacterium flavidum TaxID=2762297 RepID=A0ABR6Y781_9BURK|nr:hypothetical protein [Undibacterium flavidum]MBC3872017.1 hypothetical protein [Undibacterium flavidum]